MADTIKKYVVSKRMLYTLCFIALFIIDWTRGSQVGAVWAWTINMTGVVMAVILFSAYSPKEFRKPVYLLYSVAGIASLPAAYFWWTLHQAAIFRDQLLTIMLNLWLIGIFVIKIFLETAVYRTRKLRFCKTEIIAAALLLWMLFSVNEDVWPGWYLVMFGLFYHTEYTKQDAEALKNGMLDGIIAAFFLLQGAAFVVRPYDIVRYSGIYINCNINALFYGIVWTAFLLRLYDIRKKKEKKWKEVLCFLFAGATAAFSFMTGCRTAWLSMIVTGFFYVILADFCGLRDRAGGFLRKLAFYALVTCISIPITYAAARYIPPIFHHPVWFEGEYGEGKVHSFDPWDSEKYISWDTFLEASFGRVTPILKMIFGERQAGLTTVQAAEKEIVHKVDSSIQVRVDFWKFYMQNGNLKGHLRSEGHDLPDFPESYIWHAQNTFVQFWYYYGIPSAILLVAVTVMLLFMSIQKMRMGQDGALACLMYVVFWVMYGLSECVWYPGQMILFLVFFTPKLLQQAKESEKQTSRT